MHGRLLASTIALLAVLGGTAAAAPGVTELTIRPETLTATTALRGTVSFRTPAGWHRVGRSSDPTPGFDVRGADGCRLRLTVSLRGVTTRETPAQQVARAVGIAPLGQGSRRGGRWGTGTLSTQTTAGPMVDGLYGIAPVRVRSRRYGQVRVLGSVTDCPLSSAGAQALLAAGGPVVGQVDHLLAHADTRLHVQPVRSEAPRLVGTPSARYAVLRGTGGGRFVSIGVVLRLDRALDRHRYGVLAAPGLRPGQDVPDRLFGGAAPGRIGRPSAHCYVAEAAQLRQRSSVGTGRWHVAIHSAAAVISNTRPVQLERAPSTAEDWTVQAARRLGC